jgi:hypothetical protein
VPYTTFLAAEVASLHRRVPAIKVGATLEYDAAASQTAFTRALIAASDVAIFTHYPFRVNSFTVETPTITRSTFDNMIALAGGKPVVMQGYPASPTNGSSEDQQAAFYTDAITQWRARGSTAMPFVNLFLLHDFTPQQCNELGVYYGLPNQAPFLSFLCTLGLRRADGSARPAWTAVRDASAWLRVP